MKIFFILTLSMFSLNAFSNTAVIGNVTYQCEGSLSMNNGTATCNGKPMTGNQSASGPCGGSPSKAHPNGGGLVDVRAKVSASAAVSKTATVCGNAKVGDNSVILDGASINGSVQIGESARIEKGVTINGGGTVGKNVVVQEGATLNGNLELQDTVVKKGTTLNGNIKLVGISISGGVSCSGSGEIRSATPTGTK